MPDIGTSPNKTYQRSDGTRTGAAVCVQERDVAKVNNTAELADARENDFATAVSNRLMRDGGNKPTANLPMGSFKHTGVAVATGAGEYAEYAQMNTAISAAIGEAVAPLATTAYADALVDALGTAQSVTANSATLNIDYSAGAFVKLSLAENVTTLTVSNWPATGSMGRMLIEVTNTGSFNITDWPGATIWTGGTMPTLTSGNGKKDTYGLMSSDGGSTFRGYVLSQDMS